jgi:hypothetical protein
METVSYSSTPRRQRNSFKRKLSTSDCILTLVYYFLRLLFKGFCTKNKKNFERFSTIFCYPVVYLLRFVNAIKWRRIFRPSRVKKYLKRIINVLAFKTLIMAKQNGKLCKARLWKDFRIWKRGRTKDYSHGKSSYKMEFDVRNV